VLIYEKTKGQKQPQANVRRHYRRGFGSNNAIRRSGSVFV